jgi:hypothetical protein
MDGFTNFRLVFYCRGKDRVCRLHADLPEGPGLSYLFFVMYECELEQFASPSCLLSDGYHKLEVWGDSCRFFDLELPGQKHGVAPIRYYSATIPVFVRKLILRMARRVWARESEEETTIPLGPERVARWLRLYGLGKGTVDLTMTDETREFLEQKLSEPGSNLGERIEQLKTIARNGTRALFESTTVRLCKDWDGFTFSTPGLFGGIVNHGRERPDWSIHT